MRYLFLLPVGVAFTAAAMAAAPAPKFKTDIVPILKTRCAVCHMTGTEPGKLALHPPAAYASLVNVQSNEAPALKRVLPGKPEKSYLIMKLEGTHIAKGGKGARMPFGSAPLKPEEIAKFKAWVKAGAKNN